MLAVTLTLSTLITLLFLIVGFMAGWLVKQYLFEKSYSQGNYHPEMFDENGNLIPDEILAVRFENDDDDEDSDD